MRISDWSSDVCSSDLLLSELPAAKGCGIDISAAAVEQAAVNAARLDLDARARFLLHSWAAGLALEGTSWDVIVSNPPYIASGDTAGLATEVEGPTPTAALDCGADGLAAYQIGRASCRESWVQIGLYPVVAGRLHHKKR